MSLRWYAFLCGFGSDVLFTIDHLRSTSFFCQNAHHVWLTKEYISNWFLVLRHQSCWTPQTKHHQFSCWRSPESRPQYWLERRSNIGQGNGLVPEGGGGWKRPFISGPTRVILTVTRAGIDFLEFTPLYCVRDRHVTYVKLRWFLTNRASIH